jgi:hypothetical protein
MKKEKAYNIGIGGCMYVGMQFKESCCCDLGNSLKVMKERAWIGALAEA